MKNKNIIYLGFNNPLKHKRGVENVILFQSQSLNKNTKKYYIFFDEKNEEFIWENIKCISIKKDKNRFFTLNKKIIELSKKNKVVIHSHNYLMSFFLLKKTDIFTVHDGLYYLSRENNHKLKNLFKIIEKIVYKKSKIVHFISKFSKENSLYKGDNYKIIYNTTPLEKIVKNNKLNDNIQWKNNKMKIFSVRSIEERANIDLLIELAKIDKNIDIKIAGKGPLLEKYREIIIDKKINNIELLGYISDEDVIQYYKLSNMVLNIALYGEGFGLPIIEGYLFDKPVLASNICAIPEIIIDKQDLVENNVEKIEEKIQNYKIKENKYINYYYNNFSYNIILEKYRLLYEKI